MTDTAAPDAVPADTTAPDQDAADARQQEMDAFDARHAQRLDRDDDFRLEREKLAERDAGRASELYKSGRERAAEKEAAETAKASLQRESAERARQEKVAKATHTADAHQDALRRVVPQVQQAAQQFQQVLNALPQITDATTRDRAVAFLKQTAPVLDRYRTAIAESTQAANLASEFTRMTSEVPALADPVARRELREAALRWGHTVAEINNASPEAVKRGWARLQREKAELKKAQDAKTARKAEKKRVEALPLHARVAEAKGQPDAATLLYGAPAERSAHRRAIQKALNK